MDPVTVRVAGYKELQAAFKILYPELRAELREGLKEIVKAVESSARNYAAIQGFTPPGRSGRGVGNLIGQIRSGVTQTKGYVADRANRNGYFYPARYEYQSSGERAFLHPAIRENEGKIIASLEAVVEHVVSRFNEGAL